MAYIGQHIQVPGKTELTRQHDHFMPGSSERLLNSQDWVYSKSGYLY